MKIKVSTEISNQYNDTEVIIHARELTKDVQSIIDIMQNLNINIKKIVGTFNNDIFVINLEDIICFYSQQKSNYCKTDKGTFKIKQSLYELEENLLSNDFIRISNSCIININKVESFNTSIVGTIMVKFNDGTVEYVSRRRISQVMKKIKGGM